MGLQFRLGLPKLRKRELEVCVSVFGFQVTRTLVLWLVEFKSITATGLGLKIFHVLGRANFNPGSFRTLRSDAAHVAFTSTERVDVAVIHVSIDFLVTQPLKASCRRPRPMRLLRIQVAWLSCRATALRVRSLQ